jgi:hypothetical protein
MNHRNLSTRSKIIAFLVHFSATSRTVFRSFFGHRFTHTDKTTVLSTTKRCTHINITPIHLFQFVEPLSSSYNQTYSTFYQQNIHTYRAKIDYDTIAPTPDRLRLYNEPSCTLQHLLHLSGPDVCAQKPTHHALTTSLPPNPSPPKTFNTNTKTPPTSPDFGLRDGFRLYFAWGTRSSHQKIKLPTTTSSKRTKYEIRV